MSKKTTRSTGQHGSSVVRPDIKTLHIGRFEARTTPEVTGHHCFCGRRRTIKPAAQTAETRYDLAQPVRGAEKYARPNPKSLKMVREWFEGSFPPPCVCCFLFLPIFISFDRGGIILRRRGVFLGGRRVGNGLYNYFLPLLWIIIIITRPEILGLDRNSPAISPKGVSHDQGVGQPLLSAATLCELVDMAI